jgi:predicted ATPase
MIKKLTIDHFKSIHELTIELGKINIFLGANGSGKTNILESLGVVSAAVSGIVDDESLLRRGVRPGVPRLYKTSSQKFKTYPHIGFKVKSEECEYRISLLNPLEEPRPRWSYKTETFCDSKGKVHSWGVKTNKNPEAGNIPSIISEYEKGSYEDSFIERLRNYAIYNPNTPTLRGLIPDMQSRLPIGLSGGGLAEGVQLLKKAAYKNEDIMEAFQDMTRLFSWIKDINTSKNVGDLLPPSVPRQKTTITFVDKFMYSKHNKLTAADASEGVLYVLFLAVLCLSEDGPELFAVDNIDQAINPRLVREMMRMLCEWFETIIPTKQILCTAHNPSILDGLDVANDQYRVFLVDRNDVGATVVKRVNITPELIQKSQELKLPLSRLWVEGHLGGGVPNV